jgi:FtsP/CotA-like multicopper oxidase with cupredoxin domain
MKKLIGSILLAAILLPAISHAQLCGPDDIQDPEQFLWTHVNDATDPHWVGTMEIVEADLTVGGESIHTRVYKQDTGDIGIPGPTMKMKPGEKYILKFRNKLPYAPKSTEHNVFKDPNVSNLHTHGLHISGESPSDDVTRSFEGGAGGDFVYDIPADHMGGTFWYHAHHHGSTYLQVSGGAFGMIVIDDSSDEIPASVAAMEERQLVVAYLDPDVAGTGGDTLISGTLSPTWTVNGQVNGKMCVPPDTWQHWRVLLADRDAKEKTVSVGSNCELALMARDGVWRTEVPKPLPNNSIDLTGASRADLAVRCNGDANLSVGGQTVATVLVDAVLPSNPGAHPYDQTYETTWLSKRPNYLRDLRGLLPSHSESINMGARTINGSKFNHDVPTFTLDTDGVQQLSLKGATNHPFHLHIYHVQVQADCGDFEAGEYYDVVSGNCSIRFDLSPDSAPYDGRTIMHCHILEHEDQGAMGWADVDLGFAKAAPTFPGGYGYDFYFPANVTPGTPPAAPTNLRVTFVSSNQIDLTWTDNSDNETLFNIERSLDGTSYGFHASVGTNVESYSDSGLDANTPYWYQVSASNPEATSLPSEWVSATTELAAEGSSLLVRSITVGTENAGKGQKRESAIVVVEDDAGNLIGNATVTGMFTGTITEQVNGAPTGPGGSTTLVTSGSVKGSISFEFCVTLIEAEGLTSFVAENGVTCARF